MVITADKARLLQIIRDNHPICGEADSPWHPYYLVWRAVEREGSIGLCGEFLALLRSPIVIPKLKECDRVQFARWAEVRICHQISEAMPEVMNPPKSLFLTPVKIPVKEHKSHSRFDRVYTLIGQIRDILPLF